MSTYRTIAEPACIEPPKIKGSRFIASVAFAGTEEEARAHVASVRKQHHAARHVCWAFRVGDAGEHCRSSDDGEPGGSAGRPILTAIEGVDVTYVAVAVVRYYGGTKLGVGGLVRAYGGAAQEGLAVAGVHVVVPTRAVTVSVPYDSMGAFETFCVREGVARPEGAYGQAVTFVFAVPEQEAEDFGARLVEASAGRIGVEVADESEVAAR
ncbi:MAG: YigZ family protein [Deltaproteobacteria bacterium]|nr:YigZ family protein [Deltaproteobacteria bacterium]